MHIIRTLILLHLITMAKIQINNFGEDLEELELTHCWWECKLIQLLGKTVLAATT